MADYSNLFDQQFGQQGGTQLYRSTPYVKVGQNILSTPTEIALSEMYSAPKTAPRLQAGEAQMPRITPPAPEQPTGTTGYDINAFLSSNPNWQQITLSTGQKAWMPAGAENGDYYEGPDGALYEYKNGKWEQTTATVEGADIRGQIGKASYHSIEWTSYLEQSTGRYASADAVIANYLNNTYDTATALARLEEARQVEYEKASQMSTAGAAYDAGASQSARQQAMIRVNKDFDKLKQAIQGRDEAFQDMQKLGKMTGVDVDTTKLGDQDYARDLQSQMNDIVGATQGMGTNINLVDLPGIKDFLTVDFGQQAAQLMKQIDENKLDIFTELGTINYDTLREQGAVGEWLANAFEEAGTAGILQQDYIKGVDENGNIQFSNELEDLFKQYDDVIADQQDALMKNMRLQAAIQGVSERDVVFTNTMNAWIDNATMQSASQIAETLKADLSAGYESMGNSIVNMLRQMAGDAAAQNFASILQQQKDDALSDYNMQMEMIAEETAQRKGAGFAQILQGLISAAATAAMILI